MVIQAFFIKQQLFSTGSTQTHVLIPIPRHSIQFHCRINFFAIRLAYNIYFFSVTEIFSAKAAKQWLAAYSPGILMIPSPYLLQFTTQHSSDWHMVVSWEKTVQLGSRSMLTLWGHLWKRINRVWSLHTLSVWIFITHGAVSTWRESKVLSSRSAHWNWWLLYRLRAPLGTDLRCCGAAGAFLGGGPGQLWHLGRALPYPAWACKLERALQWLCWGRRVWIWTCEYTPRKLSIVNSQSKARI